MSQAIDSNAIEIKNGLLFGLDESHLVPLADGKLIAAEMAEPFAQLRQAATEAGFDLQVASSYRAFDRQLAIWNAKFNGLRPILDIHSKPLDSSEMNDWQKCQAILLFSALPGGSRHHWGCDLDYYDGNGLPEGYQLQLVEREYMTGGPCAGLKSFLDEHAGNYGFFSPYDQYRHGIAKEPWHLSYHPLSQKYLKALTMEGLASVLAQSDISGKAVILTNLEEIFERFICNIGQPK